VLERQRQLALYLGIVLVRFRLGGLAKEPLVLLIEFADLAVLGVGRVRHIHVHGRGRALMLARVLRGGAAGALLLVLGLALGFEGVEGFVLCLVFAGGAGSTYKKVGVKCF
jgi:hypothetical protein